MPAGFWQIFFQISCLFFGAGTGQAVPSVPLCLPYRLFIRQMFHRGLAAFFSVRLAPAILPPGLLQNDKQAALAFPHLHGGCFAGGCYLPPVFGNARAEAGIAICPLTCVTCVGTIPGIFT